MLQNCLSVSTSIDRSPRPICRRLVPEPGILALGIMARRLLRRVERFARGRHSPRSIAGDLAARRSRASPAGRDRVAGEQRCDFLDRAAVEHRREARGRSARRASRGRAAGSAGCSATCVADPALALRPASRRAAGRSSAPLRARGRSASCRPGRARGARRDLRRASAAWASATGSARTASRIAGSISGTGAMPSSRVRIYRPVPPTRIGSAPAAWASAISALRLRRPARGRAAVGAVTWPNSRCGDARISSSVGRALRTRRSA